MTTYNLKRFIDAQEKVYNSVLSELKSGHKHTHWIWYIFPQIQGLGKSETAIYYSIKDNIEASKYIEHPLLGKRLNECTSIIANHHVVFPYPDDLKLKSSMTLFSEISDNEVFKNILDKYYNGEKDNKTIMLLGKSTSHV